MASFVILTLGMTDHNNMETWKQLKCGEEARVKKTCWDAIDVPTGFCGVNSRTCGREHTFC